MPQGALRLALANTARVLGITVPGKSRLHGAITAALTVATLYSESQQNL